MLVHFTHGLLRWRKIGESMYLCGHFKEVFVLPSLFFIKLTPVLFRLLLSPYFVVIEVSESCFRQADFSYSFFFSLSLKQIPILGELRLPWFITGALAEQASVNPQVSAANSKSMEVLASTMQRVWATGLFICLTAQLVLCYTITLFYAVPVWRSTSTPNTVFRNWGRANQAPWISRQMVRYGCSLAGLHSFCFIASAICRMYGPWGWHHEFAHGRDSWYVVMSYQYLHLNWCDQ